MNDQDFIAAQSIVAKHFERRETTARQEGLAPGAAPKPLTDEQIDELIITQIGGNNGYHQFARAIEAAHGIGTQNEQK